VGTLLTALLTALIAGARALFRAAVAAFLEVELYARAAAGRGRSSAGSIVGSSLVDAWKSIIGNSRNIVHHGSSFSQGSSWNDRSIAGHQGRSINYTQNIDVGIVVIHISRKVKFHFLKNQTKHYFFSGILEQGIVCELMERKPRSIKTIFCIQNVEQIESFFNKYLLQKIIDVAFNSRNFFNNWWQNCIAAN